MESLGLLEQIDSFYHELSQMKIKVLASYQLNENQVRILTELKKDSLPLKQLALLLEIEKSTLSRQVAALVKMGWLTKHQQSDKRMQSITLTLYATESLQEMEQQIEQQWMALFHSWPDEEKQLLSILFGRVTRNLQQSNLI